MTTAKISLFYTIGFIALVIVNIFLIFSLPVKNDSTLVYVDNAVVFSEFNLSKDLNKLHRSELENQGKKVDSLVSLLRKKLPSDPENHLEQLFVEENDRLNEMNKYFSNEISIQVWERLNAYIQEFGEQNNYNLILGTRGDGNIMHAKEGLDVTEAFLKFANDRYEGNAY